MLRAAVVLALVAVALAQSSPYSRNNDATTTVPYFSNVAAQVRFVPRPGRVLAVNAPQANSLQVNTANVYRVVSFGAAAMNPHSDRSTPRNYFGNVGRERFQNTNGFGMAAQGHLALSLDPRARDRIIRDRRLIQEPSESFVGTSVAVPRFMRKYRSLPLNANDIVLAVGSTTQLIIPTGYNTLPSPSAVRYFVVQEENVAGIYSSGLRLNGDNYAANIAGSLFGNAM